MVAKTMAGLEEVLAEELTTLGANNALDRQTNGLFRGKFGTNVSC